METWQKLQHCVVEPVSALELLCHEQQRKRRRTTMQVVSTHHQQQQSISSFCCLLQEPQFSLPMGSLTELAGPAGTGKTQLALTLCVDAVMSSFCSDDGDALERGKVHGGNDVLHAVDNNHIHGASNKDNGKPKAVYVLLGGSGRFLQTISRRLQQMIQARLEAEQKYKNKNHPHNAQPQLNTPFIDDAPYIYDSLTRIFVKWICNTEELVEMLRNSLPKLLQDHEPGISMVVLDGIASLFRFQDDHYETNSYNNNNKWHQHRAGALFEISQLCRELSAEFQVPFVVVNEATSRMADAEKNNTSAVGTSLMHNNSNNKPRLEPALGMAWQQCVNSSFFIDRCSGSATTDCNATSRRRRLQCLRAPHIASNTSQDFYIDRSGAVPATLLDNKMLQTTPVDNDKSNDESGTIPGQQSTEF